MNPKRLTELWNAIIYPPEGWEGNLHFHTKDDHHIRYGYAPAYGGQKEGCDTRGAVVLTHGYGEDIDLYYETIKRYQSMGYDVFAMDWHAQGASGRSNPKNLKQPSLEGMERHVNDLDVLARHIVKPHNKDKPLIMSSNSMGGHVGMLYMHEHPDIFDGAVLSAPMLDVKTLGLPKKIFKPVMRVLFNFMSFAGLGHMKVAKDWHSLEEVEKKNAHNEGALDKPVNARKEISQLLGRMNEDQRLHVPTFGWIQSTFKTTDKIMTKEFLEDIKIPVLIGSAGDESFVDNEAHELAAKIMPQGRHVLIPDADHTLWQELGKNYDTWWSHVETLVRDVEERVSSQRNLEEKPWDYEREEDKNPADEFCLIPKDQNTHRPQHP